MNRVHSNFHSPPPNHQVHECILNHNYNVLRTSIEVLSTSSYITINSYMDFIFPALGCLWNVLWFTLIRKLSHCKSWGLIRDLESISLNFSSSDIRVSKGYLGFLVKLFAALEHTDNISDCDSIKNYYFRVKTILTNRIT